MNTQNVNTTRHIESDCCGSGKCSKAKKHFWTPILAGALVGIGISFLFNLLSAGLGLTAIAADTTTGATTLAVGGFLGILIGTIVSMGALGWVAGFLGGLKCHVRRADDRFCNYGCLYGFTAWSLALLLTILVSSHLGNFVANSTGTVVNPNVNVERVENQGPNHAVVSTHNQTATITQEEGAKSLATASFIAFALFTLGALSATIAGHIAFAKAVREHQHLS